MNISHINSSTATLEHRILTVIDECVRPYIERDGGSISFRGISGSTVFVELSGACERCTASHITLRAGVERILRKEIREITDVKLWSPQE